MADNLISCTVQRAAERTGYSVEVIRRATKAGDLPVHYPRIGGKPSSRPVILASDLLAWVAGAPTERAS